MGGEKIVSLQQALSEQKSAQQMGGDNSRYCLYHVEDLPTLTGWQKVQISPTRDRYTMGYAVNFGVYLPNEMSFGHIQEVQVYRDNRLLNFNSEGFINIFNMFSDYCYIDYSANMAMRIALIGTSGQGYFINGTSSTAVLESVISNYLQWAIYIYNLNCMSQTSDFEVSVKASILANLDDGTVVHNTPELLPIYGGHST